MKAVLCKQFGPPDTLVVEDVDDPTPGMGEVLIEVHAAGANFPDTLIIENRYQFKAPPPFTPGSEVAGVVRALGEGVDGLEVGQRVVALMTWGAFAELAVAPAAGTLPIPDDVEYATAAALLYAYCTSQHALKDRAQLKPGETLLVLGAAGGVGLAAVELGKAMGARVIGAASSPEKLAVVSEHGADAVIDYSAEDLKARTKELTGGDGADVVYDPVGGALAEQALRATAWEGRFLVVGFASGDIPAVPFNLMLLKGCAVMGVFWGSFIMREPARHLANVRELWQWLAEGRIRPQVTTYDGLAAVPRALNDLLARRATGKLVILPRT